jgi:hypothetical protein
VPLFSIWLPHHRPVRGSTTAPGLDYYRRARQGFADLFAKYQLEPPGASGLNVCMCRDLSQHPQVARFSLKTISGHCRLGMIGQGSQLMSRAKTAANLATQALNFEV